MRHRVWHMKRDETTEQLQRDIVLDFARAFPLLRKLWVWHDAASGRMRCRQCDCDEDAVSCRVCWTIEHIGAEVRLTRGLEYEVFAKGRRCNARRSWRWWIKRSSPCCHQVQYIGKAW